MPFVSDAQRKHFYANNGGDSASSDGLPSFPSIDSDELARLNRQRNDDRIYWRDYEVIRAGGSASPDAFAAYFRSAEVEAMNAQEDSYKRMWRGKD